MPAEPGTPYLARPLYSVRYGGSGGPNFFGAGSSERNILAGTTITGDTAGRSTNVDYRLDTASARAFLGQYVTLP